ncbi:hypothetical protein GLOIN_2v1766276 [Rhizophagus irregularis DAOM 181602=DAOM 197198]|nr:hypothetical protein GLOIN_2v1766276 [Rhizophagus irregularis DAOM 181602=DAOM 197198]
MSYKRVFGEMNEFEIFTNGSDSKFINACLQRKRKLVGYFKNWKATLKALDTHQVFLNKKSGVSGQSLDHNKPKKKDKKSSTKAAKDDNQLKFPNSQKKAKKFPGNSEVLAEILTLL